MTSFDAAIFDLDGLLLDTERLAIAAGYEVLDAMALPRIDGLFESLVGRDEASGAKVIAGLYGDGFPMADFGQSWTARFFDLLDQGIPLRPGATELLDELAAMDLPRAIATSSQRASALKKLKQTGLDHHFAAVVTFDCVSHPKPAPDAYLRSEERRVGKECRL